MATYRAGQLVRIVRVDCVLVEHYVGAEAVIVGVGPFPTQGGLREQMYQLSLVDGSNGALFVSDEHIEPSLRDAFRVAEREAETA